MLQGPAFYASPAISGPAGHQVLVIADNAGRERGGPGWGPPRRQRSGANRAVKCRRCRGSDTMRIPGSPAARAATRMRTSIT